ncbi:PLC-like phosphodiesterase, partial [Glomus cerebriforme]
SSQNACNGYTELCDKKYSDVAYATTHNAYAVGKSIAANQFYDIPTQLKDGIRGFMLDALYPANSTTEVHLCHHSCDLLDHGPAKDTLSQFVTWLDSNPNEVVTIFWENAGKVPAATFNDFYTQSGFVKYAHFQEAGKDWPTLNDMIGSGKRAVNFVDTGADPSVQWLMPEYDYVFETPFQNQDLNGFTCTVDRPKNQVRPMYVLNHFLYGVLSSTLSTGGDPIDFPQPQEANVTNSANLANHAKQCQQTFGKIPNFIAVDFYDEGE